MRNLKGQAAMEFLMTYGWAILVVLVAIGVLAYFGVLNPEKLLPEKCNIQSGSGLLCDKNLVNADAGTNIVTIRIKSLSDPINVTSITIERCGAATTFEGLTSTITADSSTDFAVTCANLNAGKLKSDLTIKYSISGFTKSTTGSLITSAV